MEIDISAAAGFALGIACLVAAFGIAVVWTLLDVRRDRRREAARARRLPELAALDYRGDIPRRFRVEESLRLKLETLGDVRIWLLERRAERGA